jgi:hypothetical protein
MQCSTPVIEPCVPCKHPLEYLFENAYKATLGLENKVSFSEALITILDQGLFIQNCNICCSDCGIYVLTEVESFLQYLEFFGFDAECCLNLFGSNEAWLKYREVVSSVPPNNIPNNCCDTQFQDCFNKLYCWLNKPEGSTNVLDRLLDKGIIEYGAFYDKCTNESTSGLCYISEFFKKYCNLNIGESKTEFLDRLLTTGIIVECGENGIIISSIATYIQYAEAVG